MKAHKSRLKMHQKQICVKLAPKKPLRIEKIESTDRAIDRLFYELYGLTEDKIKIADEMNS